MKRIILALVGVITLSIIMIGCATKTYQKGLYFVMDNFKYEVIGIKELRLVHCNDTSAVVNIPKKITHNGLTYKITAIGFEAFANNSNITTVVIPKTVTHIYDWTFRNCVNLTDFTIPKTVKYIGLTAFQNTAFYNNKDNWTDNVLYKNGCLIDVDTNISGIYNVPNNTRLIASQAFAGCKKLISITIPRSITTIHEGTFAGCKSLQSITIPNSVEKIGDAAFTGCSSLTSIKLPNGIKRISPYIFQDCSSLESITIPNNVNIIDVCAFEECRSLTSVTIPNSVKGIEAFVFTNCKSLGSITIPSNVEYIDFGAFTNCTNLTTITCRAQKPPTLEGEDIFPTTATLLVPQGCKGKYINSDWNNYFDGRIKEIE